MPGPVFGHIPGYPVGSWFENRAELADAGVHRHRQAGISGSASEGADSIVLSGAYEDDEDHGDVIVSTLRARLAARDALHNFCIWLNEQLGHPRLAFADLLGW